MPIRRPITFICSRSKYLCQNPSRLRSAKIGEFAMKNAGNNLHSSAMSSASFMSSPITTSRHVEVAVADFSISHSDTLTAAQLRLKRSYLGKRFNDTIRENTRFVRGKVIVTTTRRARFYPGRVRGRERIHMQKKQKLHFSCRCTFHVSFLFHLSNFLSYSHINLQQYIRWIRLESSSVVSWDVLWLGMISSSWNLKFEINWFWHWSLKLKRIELNDKVLTPTRIRGDPGQLEKKKGKMFIWNWSSWGAYDLRTAKNCSSSIIMPSDNKNKTNRKKKKKSMKSL